MSETVGELHDDREQGGFIGLVPREGLNEQRDAVLVGGHAEHELFQVPPTVFGIAVGEGHVTGVAVFVVLPADAHGGGVHVNTVGPVIGGQQAVGDDLVEELGRAVRGNGVECPDQHVVV